MNKLLLLSFLLIFFSCRKEPAGQEVPVISFLSYSKVTDESNKDSALTIVFSYKDDDGDLGYDVEADTNYPFGLGDPYFYNLRCSFFSIENGQRKFILDANGDTVHYSQRLASITPEGKFKAIHGQMELSLVFTNLKILLVKPDSVQAEIQLNDRMQHLSNVITSPVIPLDL